MKKPCKECPHFIRNRHNNMIVDFADRTGKKHNCHMTEGKKDLWNVKSKNLDQVIEHIKDTRTITLKEVQVKRDLV